MKTSSRAQSGFSLIELIIVISIIVLLASILLSSFDTVQKRSRDTRRIADIQSVQKALELYYIAHSRYPDANVNACGWDVGNAMHPFMQGTGISPDFAGGTPPIDIFPQDDCSGYRYYRYPAGSYGCPVNRGAFYVLGVTTMESQPWPYPGSPGFSCPGRDWQSEFDWVTGAFED
jgi:prepilin-type N-terminal cleavage/methylation domain-containing protein